MHGFLPNPALWMPNRDNQVVQPRVASLHLAQCLHCEYRSACPALYFHFYCLISLHFYIVLKCHWTSRRVQKERSPMPRNSAFSHLVWACFHVVYLPLQGANQLQLAEIDFKENWVVVFFNTIWSPTTNICGWQITAECGRLELSHNTALIETLNPDLGLSTSSCLSLERTQWSTKERTFCLYLLFILKKKAK